MKRVVFAVNTVMTLMSSVYYAIEIKKDNPKTEVALLWKNPTPHSISLKKISNYFDRVYEISKEVPGWTVLSVETIENNLLCKKYLRDSGIYDYLNRKYSRDILMVSSDYNGIMDNIINVYYKKRTPRKIIMFEEGMALYNDKKRTLQEVIDYNFKNKRDIQPVVGASHKVDTIFAQHPNEIPHWKCKNKKLVTQSDVFADVEMWKGILNKETYLKNLSQELKGKKVLLYLGQPIQEFSKKFKPKQETDMIRAICDGLPQDCVVLVKAHPRDPASKYNILKKIEKCIIFDRRVGWYPIECLLSLFNVNTVMTLSSSAALNILDRISECNAIYTYRYFGIQVSDNWNQMYRNYGERVAIPQTLEQIKEVMFKVSACRVKKKKNRLNDLKYIKYYLSDKRK